MRKTLLKLGVMLAVATFQLPALAAGKPNILVIMTDDMPTTDISAYHRGLGAVNTPNIDSIAKQGMMISDYYAEPSCTAGRAAFLTGQYPIRTGLTSVGQPGAPIGIQKEDPLIPELLKPQGYASAYFGKWHMGDRNEFIPTAHGFDEFYGFLYHLNVMNMPEQAEFPKDSKFPGRPRQVIHSFATDKDDPAEESRWGRVGKQKISYHGDLGRERQRTFDDEVMQYTQNWLKKTVDAKKPFFLVWAPTRMHQQVWVSEKYRGKSGHNQYNDGVLQLDDLVGQMLDSLEKLGVKNDTIVIFTSDNSVNLDHWPNSGSSMFRGQKGTTYDGGFRVPALVMWPGHIPAGEWTGEFFTSEDWLPTHAGHGGRGKQQGIPDQGHEGRRDGLQSPHRRLRPARHAAEQGKNQTPRVLLLWRHRPERHSHRSVEGAPGHQGSLA